MDGRAIPVIIANGLLQKEEIMDANFNIHQVFTQITNKVKNHPADIFPFVKEINESLREKVLDYLATIKPEQLNDGQYVIFLLSVINDVLAGLKAIAIHEKILKEDALVILDKLHIKTYKNILKAMENGEC